MKASTTPIGSAVGWAVAFVVVAVTGGATPSELVGRDEEEVEDPVQAAARSANVIARPTRPMVLIFAPERP